MGSKGQRDRSSRPVHFFEDFGHETISTAILTLTQNQIQEEQLSVNCERICAGTGNLPLGVLSRNCVVGLTDRPDMTAIDR